MTDPYTQAMNPDTPVDILQRLARSPSLDVALAVTRNPSTSPETLDALSEHSHVTVRVGVIKHESTPVETLQRLARAPDQIFDVDGGFERWSDSVYAVMTRQIRQHPRRAHLEALADLDSSVDLPRSPHKIEVVARELLAFHSIERIRGLSTKARIDYINRREGRCVDCLSALTHDEVDEVRIKLAQAINLPSSVSLRLAQDPSAEVRLKVATNPWATIDVLHDLWTHDGPNGPIAAAVSRHRHATTDLLDKIVEASDDREVLSGAAGHDALSLMSQESLLTQGDFTMSLASNPACAPSILASFAQDQSHFVRRSLAQNPSTPAEALLYLSEDSHRDVRRVLAARFYPPADHQTPLPDQAYTRLERDPDLGVRETLLKVHERRWTPEARAVLKADLHDLRESLRPRGHPDFPKSDEPSRPRSTDDALQRKMCMSGEPLTGDALEARLNAHLTFLEAGGAGGVWSLNSVAGLPLTIYLMRDEIPGTQLSLRNTRLAPETSLSGHNLSFANLTGACCEDVDLSGADLTKSMITDGFWAGTNFTGAHLRGADLSGSDLRGACFVGADLSGADFEQTNCEGADFTGANLKGSSWASANLKGIIR